MLGRYVAGAGERNDLSLTSIWANTVLSGFRVNDTGAAIAVGLGCDSRGSDSAECVATSGFGLLFVRVDLGTGDDVLQPTATSALRVDGGPGDDRLLGGTWYDELNGGGGTDELRGNAGDDVLSDGDDDRGETPDGDLLDGGPGAGDWVSYETRKLPVTVDLEHSAPDGGRGEDTLIAIENVHGGSGDDRLSGNSGPNWFDDEGGTNVLRGRGGDDLFRAARAGRVDCGRGDDEVRGATERVVLARNCERLVDPGQFLEVNPYPRLTRTGLAFDFPPGEDPPTGSMTVRESMGERRVVARGPIRWTNLGAAARLRLTADGRRILRGGRVRATVRVLAGERKLAWGIVLGRRHP
jgi:hypothetical protein